MSFDAHKNFAYSTIATAPSPASSGTSLVVAAADGAKFPAVSFNALVWPANTQPSTTNAEIVRVTTIATDTFTITRTQEGTSARTIVVGDQIACVITAKTITDIEGHTHGEFGDGSDGAAAFDGSNAVTGASRSGTTYTLTRDVFYTSMTVSSGVTVVTASYRIFVSGTLTNAGTIHNDGAAGSGTTAGAGAANGSLGGGTDGGAGAASGTGTTAGTAGTAVGSTWNTLGGQGGAGGGNGAAAGGAKSTPARLIGYHAAVDLIRGFGFQMPSGNTSAATGTVTVPNGGGTGGGGGGRTSGGTAAAGGGGGGGAGVVIIVAKTIDNSAGTIRANGGNGGNATGGTVAAGGGGGGGGGLVVILYNTITTGTEQANGGTKGTALNGATAAADGSAGTVLKFAFAVAA